MKQTQYLTTVQIKDGVLLFNTLNSALVKLSPEEYEEMQQFISAPDDGLITPQSTLIDELISLEMIVASNRNEFSELEQRYWNFRNSAEYIKVVIAPTSSCNFSCIYCFERGNYSATMSDETAQEIVQQIKDKLTTQQSKGLALIWYGGEPLMAWNTVRDITSILYQFCRRADIRFDSSVVTNGYLLSENRICKLKENGCNTIQITLDGDNVSHDIRRPLKNGGATFQKIYDNVALCSRKLNTCVRINIDKDNIQSAKLLVDRLSRDHLTDVYLSFARTEPFNNYGKTSCFSPREFASVEVELLTYAIKAGMKNCIALPKPNFGFCEAVCKHSLLFDPDGDFFFCWENVGRKELTNCSTCNQSLFVYLKDYFENTYSFFESKCMSCPILPICLGGCPQRRLETGSAQCSSLIYNLKDQIVLYYREHFEADKN